MVKKIVVASVLLFAVSSVTVGCGDQQVDPVLLAEKEAARAQVSFLEAELTKAQDALEEARRDLTVAQIEAATLRNDLEAAEQDIKEAPLRLSSLQSEIASLQSEVSSSRNQVASLEDSLAWEQAREAAVIDQTPEVPWSVAFTYIDSTSQAEQTFVPALPVLVAVEVNIVTGSPTRGDDTITLEILDDTGASLASVSKDVAGGFDGWLRFDIEGGLDVAVGSTLTIRLSDAGNVVFGWKFVADVYEPGSRATGGSPKDGDFLFRTFGLAIRQ